MCWARRHNINLVFTADNSCFLPRVCRFLVLEDLLLPPESVDSKTTFLAKQSQDLVYIYTFRTRVCLLKQAVLQTALHYSFSELSFFFLACLFCLCCWITARSSRESFFETLRRLRPTLYGAFQKLRAKISRARHPRAFTLSLSESRRFR